SSNRHGLPSSWRLPGRQHTSRQSWRWRISCRQHSARLAAVPCPLARGRIIGQRGGMDQSDLLADVTRPGTWPGFAAMCLGMFMAILDIQVVVTSLPVIQDALEIGADRMSWIQTAYLIAEVIAIPMTGYLTRALTMRGLFVIAPGVFTIASIACAVSVGFTSLVVSRIIQG